MTVDQDEDLRLRAAGEAVHRRQLQLDVDHLDVPDHALCIDCTDLAAVAVEADAAHLEQVKAATETRRGAYDDPAVRAAIHQAISEGEQ